MIILVNLAVLLYSSIQTIKYIIQFYYYILFNMYTDICTHIQLDMSHTPDHYHAMPPVLVL